MAVGKEGKGTKGSYCFIGKISVLQDENVLDTFHNNVNTLNIAELYT